MTHRARTHVKALAVAAGVLFLGSIPCDAEGASADDGALVITYDHGGTNSHAAYHYVVRVGQTIRVKIKNTCAKAFSIGIDRVKVAAVGPSTTSAVVDPCGGTEKDAEPIIHEEQFGLYKVTLINTSGAKAEWTNAAGVKTELNNVEINISVSTSKFDYEFAGGFTVSQLTDPRFGLQSREVEEGGVKSQKLFVVEDYAAGDDARLGAAAFIHVFHTSPKWKKWALSFGLGVDQGSTAGYFVGPTWRLGDSGALTLGYNWGSVDRLPAGTDLSKPVDANFLSGLGKRVDGDIFLSFSYKFLGNRSLLEKGFKQATEPAAAATAAGGGVAKLARPKLKPIDAKRCELTWDDVTGAEKYRVEGCASGACVQDWAALKDGTVKAAAFSAFDAAEVPVAGATYSVFALKGTEQSERSNVVSAAGVCTKPSDPKELVLAAADCEVTWKAADGATSHKVQTCTTNCGALDATWVDAVGKQGATASSFKLVTAPAVGSGLRVIGKNALGQGPAMMITVAAPLCTPQAG